MKSLKCSTSSHNHCFTLGIHEFTEIFRNFTNLLKRAKSKFMKSLKYSLDLNIALKSSIVKEVWFLVYVRVSLCPSGKAPSFDGFGSISWHSILVFIRRLFHIFFTFFRISNVFNLSITEEAWVVEVRIWCINIGNVLVLHFNPWVEASAGGLLVPEGLYSPVVKYFSTCFKMRIGIELSIKKSKFHKFISKRRIISLRHSSILLRIWFSSDGSITFFTSFLGFPTFSTWASMKRLE
jgi:hypothetical protein